MVIIRLINVAFIIGLVLGLFLYSLFSRSVGIFLCVRLSIFEVIGELFI